MFTHYLTVAARNFKKYKLQSIISIAGLAIGFVCFTLSMIWIRYEMTYDSFHKDADLIYRVRYTSTTGSNGFYPNLSYSKADYLKKTFPEIKAACAIRKNQKNILIGGVPTKVNFLEADSAFFDTFSASILSGNKSVLEPESKGYAISDKAARKWFGKEIPIGKEISTSGGGSKIVEAVTSSWSTHSNILFDIIEPIGTIVAVNGREPSYHEVYIRIQKGTDVVALQKKLDAMVLTPITTIHYQSPDNASNIRFHHVVLFAISGGLVILCALFNFLTLFISRIRIRGKELALRKVSGASNASFLYLLCTELALILICSIITGMLLLELVQPKFIELAQMQNKENGIFADVLLYAGIITVAAFLISLLPVQYFRRKTLLATLQGKSGGNSKNLFRKGSILLQLVISIGLMFCTSILLKQVHFLTNSNLGLERKNISTLIQASYGLDQSVLPVLKQEMEKLPSIREALDVSTGLFPQDIIMNDEAIQWDNMVSDAESVAFEVLPGGPKLIRFYNFTFVKGRGFLPEDDANKCAIINESFCKKLGWHDPIGKTFKSHSQTWTVIGVIKDYHNNSPVIPPHPVSIRFWENHMKFKFGIVYKYMDNQKEESKQQVQKLLEDKFPNAHFSHYNAEEEYAKYIQSERYLLLLLGFISAVCILVCAFGVYSLASLTTEERRKSIAVRKVNGATTVDILDMFFRENLLLLCLASGIAFPAGYVIMKSFLQGYATQTGIAPWIFLSIFIFNGLVVISSVFSSVWKAANENPAHVVKSE